MGFRRAAHDVAGFCVGAAPYRLGATSLAYLVYFRGMRDISATAASVLALVEPLTAAALAVALFGENLSLSQ
jgi:drug/metabolite transporter (DMT)-like permease